VEETVKGLETDQVRQFKQLQEENGRLKRLVAELTLDKTMLQYVLAKKTVTPSRRPVVSYLHDIYRASERRACRVARIPISTFRYESMQEPRTALRLRIREIAQTRVRYGYRKIRVLLNREGWKVGKKLVYRLYREEGLTLRHKPRRRRRASMHSGLRPPTRCGSSQAAKNSP
jgi:putative transposase